ncbi:protoporphyrinogen/coproporphyrinogen oxidase [Demequina aurantiaca]|uniref:protoporphyrinogen/coproporphyrinogen oxidase n=1 Tax=Demequina aurantiaca TaxID=676200 RepID=UPI00078193B3|nr:FAD-dependent oxidoreductase [Demequina aurantiaca]
MTPVTADQQGPAPDYSAPRGYIGPLERKTWVVVGGGIGGLLAARHLAHCGVDVTLLEESDSLGGRVSSHVVGGFDLDAGAESFATRAGSVATLLGELGLADAVVSPEADPAWVVTPGRAYPLPKTGWLGIPLRPLRRDVRAVLGWRGSIRASCDIFRPIGKVDPYVTVGKIARERLGAKAVNLLMRPVISGIYSRALEDLPLAAIAPGLPQDVQDHGSIIKAARSRRSVSAAGSAVQGIYGGVARVTEALAAEVEALGVTIRTDAPASAVVPYAEGWRVHIDAKGLGVARNLEADGVTIAVPGAAAHELQPDIIGRPEIDDRFVALVTLVVDEPALDSAPRGTGVLVSGDVTRAKALTHATAKWAWLASEVQTDEHPHRHVLRLSYTIEQGENVEGYALDDASRLLGVNLAPDSVVASSQVEWHDAAPAKVGSLNPAPGLHLVGSAAGLSGIAAIVAADAVADYR